MTVKKILQERNEDAALEAAALMQPGKLIELDLSVSLRAAKMRCELKLTLADGLVYATVQNYDAVFWRQDSDFKNLQRVCYKEKKKV